MPSEVFVATFRGQADRFDKIAAIPYTTAEAIAGEIDRTVYVAVRALNQAAESGLFPAFKKMRDGLYRPRKLSSESNELCAIDFFAKRSCADLYKGGAAGTEDREQSRLLGLWIAATGASWLVRDYPDEFDPSDPGLDWPHHTLDPNAKEIVEVKRNGSERWVKATPPILKLLKAHTPILDFANELEARGYQRCLRRRLPDGALPGVEENYTEGEMIERNRARSKAYARACQLLARIASENPDDTSECSEPPQGGPLDDEAHLSPAKLAERFGLPLTTVQSRLRRFRRKNGGGWIENRDRKQNEAQFVFRVGDVRSVLEPRVRTTSKTTSERPAKKK